MNCRRFARMAVVGALALATAALLPSARAEEPDRSQWLVGRTYERSARFTAPGEAEVEFYVASQEGPASEAETAWFRLLLVKQGEVVESYAIDVTRTEGEPTRLDLRWEDQGSEDEGVRVGAALVPEDGQWADAARLLVANAVAAGPAWREASAQLAQAAEATDLAARRPLALAAYRALEGAAERHPTHLGLLNDLLVADQILVPLEVGSDRGANLAFAWRAHMATARSVSRDDMDFREALRTALVCSMAEGCYAFAASVLATQVEGDDPELDTLRAGIQRLGQQEQEHLTPTAIEGPTGALLVAGVRCNAEPVGEGLLFHRLSFFTTTTARPHDPTPVWYSLTCEKTEARTRWSLYGWVGGSRRLLRLYGAEEPDGDAVTEVVLGQMRAAVGQEQVK
jgi:hypothetical protein